MIVSNTEVTSYSICKRQHYYRFVLDVEPKRFSRAITRGLIGHEALEMYYKEMKEGSPLETCKKGMLSVVEGHIKRLLHEEEYELVKVFHHLRKLLDVYAEYYSAEPFRIIAVEDEFSTSITDSIKYALKLDLLIEFTKGEFRGDFAVIDHKFVYNFKSQAELEMDGQIPKYVKTVKDTEYYVTKGFFNQVRYREMANPSPKDLFRRTISKPKPIQTERIWTEQHDLAVEIAEVKQRSDYDPPRSLSYVVCRDCYFQPLCYTELIGEDITEMIHTNFQKNTYGYSEIEEPENGEF